MKCFFGELGGRVGNALRFLKGGGYVSVDMWEEEICGRRSHMGKDVEELHLTGVEAGRRWMERRLVGAVEARTATLL